MLAEIGHDRVVLLQIVEGLVRAEGKKNLETEFFFDVGEIIPEEFRGINRYVHGLIDVI